jgi:hypothetical protein
LAEKRCAYSCALEKNIDASLVFPMDAERTPQKRIGVASYPDHDELTRSRLRSDGWRLQGKEIIIAPAFFPGDSCLRVFDHQAFFHKKITESNLDSNKNFEKSFYFCL